MTLFEQISRARDWITMAGAAVFVIWFFVQNEAMDYVRGWVMQTPVVDNLSLEDSVLEMREFRVEMRTLVTELSDRVGSLEDRITEVEGEPQFVIHDMVRSRVQEPCPRGSDGECRYVFRSIRTPRGENCEATNVRLYVVDSEADRYQVPRLGDPEVMQATVDDYITVNGAFTLPPDAAPGVAEFFAVYDYIHCDPDKPEVVYPARSPSLIFTIQAHNR